MRAAEEERASLNESIMLRQSAEAQSHSAGFEAWLRSRGDIKARRNAAVTPPPRRADGAQIFTGDDIAEEFGVNKSSYEAVVLPNIKAYQARARALGDPAAVLELQTEAIAKELEWSEVLVSLRAAPVNPADLYNVRMGSTPYTVSRARARRRSATHGPQPQSDALKPPFVAGNDGLAVVVKVGPGVKNLSENDWVMPFKAGMGTWRSLAVWREKDVLKMPADLLPVEYAAMLRAPPPRARARARAHPRQARCAWRTGYWRTTGR